MAIEIRPLEANDRSGWEALARGYKEFYRTPTTDKEFEVAWQRLQLGEDISCVVADVDGQLCALAHYFFHTSVWTPRVCYLQDLFTAPQSRGLGLGRALIEAVANIARESGATKYYWLTQDDNLAARALYDKIARNHGFIRYDYPL